MAIRGVPLTVTGSLAVTVKLSVAATAAAQGQQSAAASHLARWRDHGLPPPHGFDPDWRRNPWLAQNGYGEVAINPDLHWTLAPTAEDDHA